MHAFYLFRRDPVDYRVEGAMNDSDSGAPVPVVLPGDTCRRMKLFCASVIAIALAGYRDRETAVRSSFAAFVSNACMGKAVTLALGDARFCR